MVALEQDGLTIVIGSASDANARRRRDQNLHLPSAHGGFAGFRHPPRVHRHARPSGRGALQRTGPLLLRLALAEFKSRQGLAAWVGVGRMGRCLPLNNTRFPGCAPGPEATFPTEGRISSFEIRVMRFVEEHDDHATEHRAPDRGVNP